MDYSPQVITMEIAYLIFVTNTTARCTRPPRRPLFVNRTSNDGSLHHEATSASAAIPPPPSGVRGLEDVEQHGPTLPLRLRPEPPAHLPGGFCDPFAAVLAAPRRRGKVELSRSLAFSCQRQQRAALRGEGGRRRRRRARRRRDRVRRRCGAARRGRRRRSACALLDDLLLSVDPPSPSPQLDHRSPARGLRENHLKWTTKQSAVTLLFIHSLTSSLAFAHLAVENVLAEEALSLVPVRVPEHGVPFYPPVLELAVENISVLIPVGEGSKRNMETGHVMTRIIWQGGASCRIISSYAEQFQLFLSQNDLSHLTISQK